MRRIRLGDEYVSAMSTSPAGASLCRGEEDTIYQLQRFSVIIYNTVAKKALVPHIETW